MSEIYAFFVGLVSEAQDSLHSFKINFFKVDTGEHLLNAPTDLADLIIFSEVVEHDEGFVQGEIERLATSLENIFHPAVIENSEYHFTSSNFDEFCVGF